MPRFFVPFMLELWQEYRLPERVLHHLNVRRLNKSESLTLFNGDGYAYLGELILLSKKEAVVRILSVTKPKNESPLFVLLAQGIASKDRMDFVLQKCVELGVSTFQPLITTRSMTRLSLEREQKKLIRWQEIVVHACEQCGRNVVPMVLPVKTLAEFLQDIPVVDAYFVLSIATNKSLKDVSFVPKDLCLIAGPEGGLSDDEEKLIFTKGFEPITLGARILRTETAAMSALAAMQVLWGDF